MKSIRTFTEPLRIALGICLMILFACTFLAGCSKDESGSDPDPDPVPTTPTISGINPQSGPAGTEVTVTGTNFSSTASENTVTFNGIAGTVLSASTTQLVGVVPDNASSGQVAVTVAGKTAQGPSFTILTGNAQACDNNEITENTTWEDLEPGDAIDYIIQCEISVKGNALLTIEPGVIIAFEGDNSGIFTSEGGGIKAVGSAAEPIKLVGSTENKGVWKGIYFGSNHPENRLEYVTVKNAGRTASGQSGEKGAVQLSRGDESRAAIVNCTIENNDGYGIFMTDESLLTEFAGNISTNNGGAPVGLFFNQLGALDTNSEFMGNAEDYVEVFAYDIEDEAVTMAKLDVPYRFTESTRYNIQNALVIDPGNILEFTSGAGFRLGEQATDCSATTGSLNATGTDGERIIFRGINAGKGTWLGIGFNSSSPNNVLNYCDISGGGSATLYNASDFPANITMQCESRVQIQNSTISDSGGFGIYMLDEDATLENFMDNSLIDNDLAPVLTHLTQVDQLDPASSYAEGNGRAYIQVYGSSITENDLTIAKLEVPYRISRDEIGRETYVERALTIEPGVILEFETAAGILLGSPGVDCIPLTGSFNAVGTAEEPIIFRGITTGQGTWLGLGINSSTSANVLEYCEISGGGSGQMYNAGGQGNLVMTCSASLEVNNCSISDSGGWGIDFVQGANSLSQANNTFSNNADGNIAP